MPKSDEIDQLIESHDLDEIGYDRHWGAYRIKLNKNEIKKKAEALTSMLEMAEKNFNK